MRSINEMRSDLERKQKALSDLKSGSGFSLGNGRIAQAEAQRRRKEIRDLQMMIEYAEKGDWE